MSRAEARPDLLVRQVRLHYGSPGDRIVALVDKGPDARSSYCGLYVSHLTADYAALGVELSARRGLFLTLSDRTDGASWLTAVPRTIAVPITLGGVRFALPFQQLENLSEPRAVATLSSSALPDVLAALVSPAGLTLHVRGQDLSYAIPARAHRAFLDCVRETCGLLRRWWVLGNRAWFTGH